MNLYVEKHNDSPNRHCKCSRCRLRLSMWTAEPYLEYIEVTRIICECGYPEYPLIYNFSPRTFAKYFVPHPENPKNFNN